MNSKLTKGTMPREIEDLYRLLLSSVQDYAIIMVDSKGTILTWSDGAENMFGYGEEEVVGASSAMFMRPQDRESGDHHYELRVAKARGRFEALGWCVRKDGSMFWASTLITAVYDNTGNLGGFTRVVRDLTERRQLEQRQSTQYAVAKILASASTPEEAIPKTLRLLCDLTGFDGACLWIAQSDQEGLICQEVVSLRAESRVSESQGMILQRGRGLAGRVLVDGKTAWYGSPSEFDELVSIVLLGDAPPKSAIAFPIFFGERVGAVAEFFSRQEGAATSGLTEIFMVVAHELSQFLERASLGDDIKEQAELTKLILQSAYDAFASFDSTGKIIDWNNRAESMFGWSDCEVQGLYLADLILPPAQRAKHRQALLDFRKDGNDSFINQPQEILVRRRDGSEFPAEMTIFPVHSRKALYFGAFIRDITERKSNEETLRQARDQAIEVSRMKSQFLAMMSHEIRTPLNGILGISEILLRSTLDHTQKDYARTINETGRLLLSIIDDILDLSKIEAGKLSIDHSEFDIVALVDGLMHLLGGAARAKGLSLRSVVDANLPRRLRGDAGRLRQVLTNYVGNAIKFSDSGEIVVALIQEERNGNRVRLRISVTDEGIGLSADEVEQLFQPFVQVDSSKKRKYRGTGLGLSICKRLADLMGADTGVDSQKGVGSTFWISVPLEAGSSEACEETENSRLGLTRLLTLANLEERKNQLMSLAAAHGMRAVAVSSELEALNLLHRSLRDGDCFKVLLIDMDGERERALELASLVAQDDGLSSCRLFVLIDESELPLSRQAHGMIDLLPREASGSEIIAKISDALGMPLTCNVEPEAVIFDQSGRTVPLREEKILVVEDNIINQQVATLLLRDLGFRADVTPSGLSALELIKTEDYDLLFMDCHMPGLDGYETTAAIRDFEQGRRHVPIVAMTADIVEGTPERCLASGMDDYMSKPIQPETLKQLTERWLPLGKKSQ